MQCQPFLAQDASLHVVHGMTPGLGPASLATCVVAQRGLLGLFSLLTSWGPSSTATTTTAVTGQCSPCPSCSCSSSSCPATPELPSCLSTGLACFVAGAGALGLAAVAGVAFGFVPRIVAFLVSYFGLETVQPVIESIKNDVDSVTTSAAVQDAEDF